MTESGDAIVVMQARSRRDSESTNLSCFSFEGVALPLLNVISLGNRAKNVREYQLL